MAKFVDFMSDKQVQDIMESFLQRFPQMFSGFDVSKIGFVTTKAKKKGKEPREFLKLHKVPYPYSVWISKTYIVECTSDALWSKASKTQKNLAAFRVMCAIPENAFDEQSKQYGKVLPPEIKMYMREYAASGGVPNWMENPAAKDPLEDHGVKKDNRKPVMSSDIESLGRETEELVAVGQ
jgi:hypothetical protein